MLTVWAKRAAIDHHMKYRAHSGIENDDSGERWRWTATGKGHVVAASRAVDIC
jgi:hypothetical protein